MEEISKKELLLETGISYGQLYRWKREGLIPEEWFVKRAAFTGQETFFPRERALERVRAILSRKDECSLEEIRREFEGGAGEGLDALLREAVAAAADGRPRTAAPAGKGRIGDACDGRGGGVARAVLFETNDGRHFVLFMQDGTVVFDGGARVLRALSEEEFLAFGKEMGDEI